MNEVLSILAHPRMAFVGLFGGLASFGALAMTIQSTCSQLAHLHGVPLHLATQLDGIGLTLSALGGAAVIIAATGESVLSSVSRSTPPEGTPNLIPFPVAATEPQPPPLMDQQKAA